MNPAKGARSRVVALTDLPNVGQATAGDLRLLGIDRPSDLVGRCPYEFYDQLCATTGSRQDPCVMDVLISVTHFMNGGEARAWWSFTAERKAEVLRRAAP
ncbi:MAG TPA: helix-hairpin-helix domain-containing protein [Gemmatimonadales bacterium]|nr:helix-hairpin-helix domain-containing protein [Gemmatimonadales bacterium]